MRAKGEQRKLQKTQSGRSGFTLLEIMLAVAIMSMTVLVIYRFLELNLTAITVSSQAQDESLELRGFSKTMQSALAAIPQNEPGALLSPSQPAPQANSLAQDQMQILCNPGNALFTQFAITDTYQITLLIQKDPTSGISTLGLLRIAVSELNAGSQQAQQPNWLPLIKGVQGLEIRYFDPRQNSWLNQWTDQNRRPSLVQIRIWKDPKAPPFVTELSLPANGADNAQSGGGTDE